MSSLGGLLAHLDVVSKGESRFVETVLEGWHGWGVLNILAAISISPGGGNSSSSLEALNHGCD